MLKKQYRLKKRKTFNYIHRNGRHVGCEVFALVFVYARMKDIKAGFSVSKKIGNSVVRHRATRVMREAFKPLIPNIKPNHSLVFVAKPGIEKLKPAEITVFMERVLQKAGLLL